MQSGIYKISNTINEKIYIGSAVNFNNRWRIHKYHLLKGTHHNPPLQNFVNKYGFYKLIFSIVELCKKENLVEREQFYLDIILPEFNIHKQAQSPKGLKRTQEQIQNIINGKKTRGTWRKKGYIPSQETRKKIGDAHRGKKISDKQKENHSKIMKGRKINQETKDKISKGLKGRLFSEEHKRKLSEKAMGNTNGKNIDYTNPERSRKIIEALSIPIIQMENGIFTKEWRSSAQAAKSLKLSRGNIYSCITGKRKTTGGFSWKKK